MNTHAKSKNQPAFTGKVSRKKAIYLSAAICMIAVFSCEEEKGEEDKTSYIEKGQEAAATFCDCYSTKSKTTCLEELKDNYSASVYLDKNFISAFNQAQKCNVELEIIQEYK
jgi:hypothetical protein